MLAFSVCEGITKEHLQQVYSDPYIARVGHDHRPFAPIIHPLVTYLTATVGDMFAGAFMAIRTNSLDMDLHALLKREHVKYSRDLGLAFLAWAFSQGVERVSAPIIEGLESVRNYCLKLGFKYEGFKRDAVMQNGQLKGVHMLGMTRRDWSKK